MVAADRRPYDRFVTQTARRVGRGGGRAAKSAPAGRAARPARGQALAGKAASWYAALPVRRREIVQDSGLALGLAVLNLLSLLPYQSQLHPLWLAYFLVSVQCLPLAVRRVLPVPALICSGVLWDLYDGLRFGFAPLPLAPAIAFATVADRSRPVIRWITVAGTAGGIAYSQTLPGHNQPYDAIVQACIFGAAWVIGTLSRQRRAALADAASRAALAEASLDVAAARAAAAERLRIARELHDVVAHHVSLMAVQAEAVGALLPARPADAAQSADLIAATARQAMTELRRLLGVLRFNSSDQDRPPERTVLTPAPSLSRLGELADLMRGAGLAVALTAGSGPTPSPSVDLTAYRIVQEALTNARRHAPGSAAAVTVAWEDGYLTVEVTNTAATAVPAAAVPLAAARQLTPGKANAQSASAALVAADLGGGYGLAGIAERVASCGGSLSLGPGRDGSFTVTARLPLT
jgi:signal transduction histidine kinase